MGTNPNLSVESKWLVKMQYRYKEGRNWLDHLHLLDTEAQVDGCLAGMVEEYETRNVQVFRRIEILEEIPGYFDVRNVL